MHYRTLDGKQEIVVTGGFTPGSPDVYHLKTQILSLTTLTWRDGNDLPQGYSYSAVAQLDKHFVFSGGYTNPTTQTNNIVRFNRV